MKAQIVVENVVTLDSIVVSARFDSFGSGVRNPFVKFIVSDTNGKISVELVTQELAWLGQDKHLHDAKNWLSGNFACT